MNSDAVSVKAAFVYALTAEVRPLLRKSSLHRRIDLILAGEKITIQFATFEKIQVAFCRTGIGIARAHEAAEKLLEYTRPEILISLGCAGASLPDLRTGDLILPDTILSETPTDRFLTSHRAFLEKIAAEEKIPHRTGALMTLWNIAGKPEKEAAGHKGAVAVDMETAAVAAIAEKAGIPLVSLRMIFDSLEEPLMSEEPFDEAHPIAYLLRNPKIILKIPRYALMNALCGKNLLRVVSRFVESLPSLQAETLF